ncbi:MAG: hypothetical protein ACKVPY_07695 [Paracoccaceae bacterium]
MPAPDTGREPSPDNIGLLEARVERDREALSAALSALRDHMRPIAARKRAASSSDRTADASPPEMAWMAAADRLRRRAARLTARIDRAERRHLAPAGDLARCRADVMASLTMDVWHAMRRGLEGLDAQARETELARRERAYGLHLGADGSETAAPRRRPASAMAALAAAAAVVGLVLPVPRFELRFRRTARAWFIDALGRSLRSERQRLSAIVGDAAGLLASDLLRTLPLGQAEKPDQG